MFHRIIKLPNGLWDKVKERGRQEQKALHRVVEDALDAELLPLIETLRQLGLKGEVKADARLNTLKKGLQKNCLKMISVGSQKFQQSLSWQGFGL